MSTETNSGVGLPLGAAPRAGEEKDRPRGRHRPRVSIGLVLMAFVTLLVVGVGALVLTLGYRVADTSTRELLGQKAEVVAHAVVERIANYLRPVEAQADFVRSLLLDRGPISLADPGTLDLLQASLAAAPQVSAIALVGPDLIVLRAFRDRPDEPFALDDWGDDRDFAAMIEQARQTSGPYWGPLFYAERVGSTYLNRLVKLDARHVLVLSVSIDGLSRFVAGFENALTGKAFILYGENQILAHPLLRDSYPGLSDERPLPLLEGFPDPILAQLWTPLKLPRAEQRFVNQLGAHVVEIDDGIFVFLLRPLDGFGERPLYVGTYFTLEEIAPHLARTGKGIAFGLAVILVSLAIALLLSRRMSRPVRRLAEAADQIKRWDFDRQTVVPRSLFKEIDDAGQALNSSIAGLRALQPYVPRRLAERLLQRRSAEQISPEEHEVTVLFSDLVGFTRLAEAMAPERVLELLNAHFSLVAECVFAEDGTLDKFIGDAAMAFWGALESDHSHARHACEAALRIAEAVGRDNRQRRARGEAPLRLCIGIHTGAVVAGNIGAPGRINYTVIGDTVNTAERLEELARAAGDPEAEVNIVISARTAGFLGPEFVVEPAGCRALPGKQAPIEAFLLKAGPHFGAPAP